MYAAERLQVKIWLPGMVLCAHAGCTRDDPPEYPKYGGKNPLMRSKYNSRSTWVWEGGRERGVGEREERGKVGRVRGGGTTGCNDISVTLSVCAG